MIDTNHDYGSKPLKPVKKTKPASEDKPKETARKVSREEATDELNKAVDTINKALPPDTELKVMSDTLNISNKCADWSLPDDVFEELKKRQVSLMNYCQEHDIPALIHVVAGVKNGQHADALSYNLCCGPSKDMNRTPGDVLLRYAYLIMSLQMVCKDTHQVCMKGISTVLKYVVDDLVTAAVGDKRAGKMDDKEKLLLVLKSFDVAIASRGKGLTPKDL